MVAQLGSNPNNNDDNSANGGSSLLLLLLPEPQKVCRIMAFWARFRGLGLLFYLLLGPR